MDKVNEGNKEEMFSEYILLVMGIMLYGIMAAMCIYLLCILQWYNLMYGLIGIAVLCVAMVTYAVIRLVNWYNKNQNNG